MRYKRLLMLGLFVFSLKMHASELVYFWHSFAGNLGATLTKVVQDFNARQSEIIIKPRYKGDYIETLTSFAAAQQANKAPGLVQVFEVGTAFMQQAPGLTQPVGALMEAQGYRDFSAKLLPGIASYYTQEGALQAMPMNVSIPVMYYNAQILQSIGYSAASFPQTWQSFDVLLHKLREKGYQCGYATAYPAWIHVEVFAALHGLPLANGEALDYNVQNRPEIKAHWRRLKRWQDAGLLLYGGRNSDATVLFTSGRCPIFSHSSGSMQSLRELLPFPLGVARLPYDAQWTQSPGNPAFGGAALWVLAGQSNLKQKGIAAFIHYLSKPAIQQAWYENTGYLPMTGWEARAASLRSTAAVDLLAIAWSAFKSPGEPALMLPQNQLRTILDQAMEAVFSNQSTIEAALSLAQKKINYRLLRYSRSHPSRKRMP